MSNGDSIKGTNYVEIQPGSSNVPVALRFKAASASTANDGSIPYGSTLISATWKYYPPDKTTASTSDLITDNNRVSSNIAYTYLTWSSDLAKGLYKLTCTATFSLSGISTDLQREFDVNRIWVKDR